MVCSPTASRSSTIRVARSAAFAALVLAAPAVLAASPGGVVRLEGRFEQFDGMEVSTFTASEEAAGSFHCILDGAYSTGERYRCGTGLPSYEVLHTFGDSSGAAVMYFEQNAATMRSFFACSMREEEGKLATFRCDRQPDPPESEPEDKLISPIAGSLRGVTIANAHQVDAEGYVFRSMAPRLEADYAELMRLGIASVLIFKNDRDGTVRQEMDRLNAASILGEHIPMEWRDYRDFQEPCELTIAALKFLLAVRSEGRKVLTHCTVGEDRTGYLAALYRLLTENQDAKTMFLEEMCERGYEQGDAAKPFTPYVLKLRQALTALYARMAERIRRSEISATNLDARVCQTDVGVTFLDPAELTCATSTRFRPPRQASN